MKRWALRILVFMLLGAIVNVAVAWVVSQHHFAILDSTEIEGDAVVRLWQAHAQAHFGGLSGDATCRRTLRFGTTSDAVVLMLNTVPREQQVVIESAAGVPCRSLFGVVVSRKQLGYPVQEWYKGFIRSPIKEQWNPQYIAVRLPVWVIWPGFAINTVFYAALLWLLFAAPFALRRRRRIKRGLCPKCAYDLRGSASQSCPECGATVPLSFAQARERDRVREPTA